MDDNVWQGEIWNRRKDGAIIPVWQTISVVRDACGEVDHFISIFSDISEKKMSEERIYHLAHYDVLTGLPNRTSFHNEFEDALLHAERHGRRVALLFLDLDQFKLINDAAGHPAGDELLKQVALRLKETVRDEDIVARLGGDEFTVLLDDIHSVEDAGLVAEKILQQLAMPFQLEQSELVVHYQYRYQRVSERWQRCRHAVEECRHCHVPRQGEGPQQFPVLHLGNEYPGARTPQPGRCVAHRA